jgi:hypothetical protein
VNDLYLQAKVVKNRLKSINLTESERSEVLSELIGKEASLKNN